MPTRVWLAAVALVMSATLAACRERQATSGSMPAVASAGLLAAACAGDSLRPATAAPAHGLWLSDHPRSRVRVAAMVGPPRPDDRALVVTRPAETVELSAAGDTIRYSVPAATVSLELLPPMRRDTLGGTGLADSAARSHPVATYAVAPHVRLGAYEPCTTSSSGPRIRYVRRDAAGKIVTDVLLHRASDH
jgi:hypothetical protein